jgi:hypothetical protein
VGGRKRLGKIGKENAEESLSGSVNMQRGKARKGRAKGGIIMGVKKGLEEENGSGVKEERGFMERTVKRKQRKWKL